MALVYGCTSMPVLLLLLLSASSIHTECIVNAEMGEAREGEVHEVLKGLKRA